MAASGFWPLLTGLDGVIGGSPVHPQHPKHQEREKRTSNGYAHRVIGSLEEW